MARRISMLIGNRAGYWRSCLEPSCRRARACLAPNIQCSNAPPLPPDPDGRRVARTVAMVQRRLRAAAERDEAEEGA